ncbi:MAG: Threonine synthase [Candidatus Roizmanbacteria bacterium GW2011_GWC2_37_13]|uniref:Threonine synthase n=1 Tax=Candidatus Roizmanbacteria bacterium GW2011_GWC2_37_13 TaxID=1618486 RepID=A0A0G0IMG8_9BACT|nr:MAG: Threonine synthase [Candidatus Roizmanbacteria bacterium GW2011_GWC1_37_12]KKQ25414.1 MAG: Threonine synthase [Candidatus Roizmanbacteria bacterium GW2011_GWC2_37_13]
MTKQKLICIKCGRTNPKKSLNCISCKGFYSLLTVEYSSNKLLNIKELYNNYLPYHLFKDNDFKNCSLTKFNKNIWLKNEGENESKSIKEKDIFVGLKVASYLGYKKTLCVSGGSGKNVVNFFQKQANFPLIKLYSPKGEDYEKTFKLALYNKNKNVWNITPGINPYSQEGSKTIAWQIIDSKIDFETILIPCGNGSSLWGIYKGFLEAKEQGFVKKVPKIFGVELKNGPIGKSLRSGKMEKNGKILNSKAHSIDVKESFSLQKAVMVIKLTAGGIINVSEKEINKAYKVLHKKKYLSNFTAAAALAGANKLKRFNKICCILTADEF